MIREHSRLVAGAGRGLLVALAAIAMWALAPPAPAADAPLSGDRIRELIVGNTLIGPLRGQLYDFSYIDDGSVIGAAGSNSDSGSWRIRGDDIYCHSWTLLFGGDERCYRWYERGGGRYTLKNVDAFRITDLEVWRIRPGLD